MLSFEQLFYSNNNSTFDRLPLWRKESKLINILTEGKENEDYEKDWWKHLFPQICTKVNLNIIWSLMTDYNFNRSFQRDPFIADFNNFENLYKCADYLQIDKVCKKMIRLILTNNYWGNLEDAPQTMIDFIKTSNEMKTLWGETFLRDEILNFWTGVSTKFNPRCWHPDLFYNTKPNQINYYSSDSDDDENSLLARYDGHNYNEEPILSDNISWWHEFWDCLTMGEWDEEKWQVMLPFLIKTNIFGLLTIFPLKNQTCPIWSSTIGLITSCKNNISPADMTRPQWVTLLFQLCPYLFTIEKQSPSNSRHSCYPLLLQMLSCGMINYVEDILYVLPKNWGKKFQNTSVIDVATQYGNYGPEIICRLYDQGFRPTVYIYEYLLNHALVYKKFLTGWNYILSKHDVIKMPTVTMDRWIQRIVDSIRSAQGNHAFIINQMKDIVFGQLLKRANDRQHRLNILSLGRMGWNSGDLLTAKEKSDFVSLYMLFIDDKQRLINISMMSHIENIKLYWLGYELTPELLGW